MADGRGRSVGVARGFELGPSGCAAEAQVGSEEEACSQDLHRRGDKAQAGCQAQECSQILDGNEEPEHNREEAGVACSQDRPEEREEIEVS